VIADVVIATEKRQQYLQPFVQRSCGLEGFGFMVTSGRDVGKSS
jgi:hypothetical protein